MRVKLYTRTVSNTGEIEEIDPIKIKESSNPVLLVAPGFLANALEQESQKEDGRALRWAMRAARDMLAQSGVLLTYYPEIVVLGWLSREACKKELSELLIDPLYVSEAAKNFHQTLLSLNRPGLTALTFSYGGAFFQQLASLSYELNQFPEHLRVLSIGHPVGLKVFASFGFSGVHAVANNDRVVTKAMNQMPDERGQLSPSLQHNVSWVDDRIAFYTFPNPIEVQPIKDETGRITPKEIFDEYAHHPAAYVLSDIGSRTCIDGRYSESLAHSLLLRRILAHFVDPYSHYSVKEIFERCAGEIRAQLERDNSLEVQRVKDLSP